MRWSHGKTRASLRSASPAPNLCYSNRRDIASGWSSPSNHARRFRALFMRTRYLRAGKLSFFGRHAQLNLRNDTNCKGLQPWQRVLPIVSVHFALNGKLALHQHEDPTKFVIEKERAAVAKSGYPRSVGAHAAKVVKKLTGSFLTSRR